MTYFIAICYYVLKIPHPLHRLNKNMSFVIHAVYSVFAFCLRDAKRASSILDLNGVPSTKTCDL